jgi:Domain of unknown function (DUF4265)
MKTSKATSPQVSLSFPLKVEDGWPPVAVECLPFEKTSEGYRALVSPLFVEDLSVDDMIKADVDDEHQVNSWTHIHRSNRTTIWLLRLKTPNQIEDVLSRLQELGCNSGRFETGGCYTIDVPAVVSMHDVDAVLSDLDSRDVAIAFPSMRHAD